MERKSLSPNLPRHPAHNASSARAPSAEGQSLSPRGAVEQVHNEVKKEELQNYISQINTCSKPEDIKNYLSAHPETGKRFQALYEGSEAFKNYIGDKDIKCLKKIADLYGNNTDAADDAYLSVIEGEIENYAVESSAAQHIKNAEKRDEAYQKLLLSIDPSNSTIIEHLLKKTSQSKKSFYAWAMLPKVLVDFESFECVISILKKEANFQKDFLRIIQNNIQTSYINPAISYYIKNQDTKEALKNLLQDNKDIQAKLKVFFAIQKPATTEGELTKKLEHIQRSEVFSMEEKDHYSLSVLQNSNQISIDKRLRAVSRHIQSESKKNEAYAFFAKIHGENTYYRSQAVERITDPALQQSILESIFQDSRDDISFRISIAPQIDNTNLLNSVLINTAKDYALNPSERYQAATKIEDAKAKDTVLLKLINDPSMKDRAKNLIFALSNTDQKDNLLINFLQVPKLDFTQELDCVCAISDSRIEKRDELLFNYIKKLTEDTYGHAGPDGPIYLTAAFKALTNRDFIQELAQNWIQDPKFNTQQDFYAMLIEKNLNELVVEVMHTSIEGLDEAAAEATLQKKLAAANAYLASGKLIENDEFMETLRSYMKLTELNVSTSLLENWAGSYLNNHKLNPEFAYEILRNPIWTQYFYESVLRNQLPIDENFTGEAFKELITEFVQSNSTCSKALCEALLKLYMPLAWVPDETKNY